jgi:cellulose synthase/poly-beta-1,6-N-acetylglucosamine synthase-like glycosyltransferase
LTDGETRAMDAEPLSILLPVRNGADFVANALTDLTAAAIDTDEILIVDDGSEDRTSRVLSKWAQRDQRIRVLRTEGLGLVAALNLGLSEVTHEWIARADADDGYPQDRFIRQREALRDGVALVTGDYRLVAPAGDPTLIPCALGHPFVAAGLIHPQRVPHPGAVYRRDAVLEVDGYRQEDFPAEDLALWMRLCDVGELVGVPAVVVDWTLNPHSISHTRQAQQRAKTAQLLDGFAPACVRGITADEVERELLRYSQSSLGEQRALLLMRDLQAWGRRGYPVRHLRPLLRHLARRPLDALAAGWELTSSTRRRRSQRQAMSRPT